MYIKGITVKLHVKTETGRDNFNFPIYSETTTEVSNVLVSPQENTPINSQTDFFSKKETYILGIPKGDTHEWKDVIVEFFGKKYKTFGNVVEGIEELVPGQWHKKVMCERYE